MVGREYQHLEDLVFCEDGGAKHAVYILKNLANYKLSIKWDGSPTVYFGRDNSGKFMLVGKNGWGREPINSAEELEQWTLSRGKNEYWRPAFAKTLADLWTTLEPLTHFKGFAYADILWSGGTPSYNSRNYYFRPNQVTYIVSRDTPLGESISKSSLGLAMHTLYQNFGDTQGVPINTPIIDSETVVAIPQTLVTEGIVMPTDSINAVEKLVRKQSSNIDMLFVPRVGLADFREIIYKYVNYLVKKKQLHELSTKSFVEWVNNSTLSFNKQGRLRDMVNAYTENFDALFEVVKEIGKVKNDIIEMLDKSPANVSAFTGRHSGGEGFVIQEKKIKLVQRTRWTPYG